MVDAAVPQPTEGPAGDARVDVLDALLDQVLTAPEAEWPTTLAAVCDAAPEHADALRRRFRQLELHGVVAARTRSLPDRGSVFGDYRIHAVLGHGAMGVVFDAVHAPSGEAVALKVLRPEWIDEPKAAQRFQKEAELAAQIDHPNVCRVLAAGEVDGAPFLAMQRIVGETLADRIQRCRRHGRAAAADPMALVPLIEKVARGLGSLHRRGLVHRDVKPGNILITNTGEPCLCDFGLAWSSTAASLTGTGAILGTPAYMPPEQVRDSGDVTPHADVYALGATMYELLAMRPPLESAQREDLFRRILSEEPADVRRANPAVSRDLATIVACCLEKQPRRRYADGDALADDLARLRAGEAIVARAPGAMRRLARSVRRQPVLASLFLAATLGLAGASVFVVQLRQQAATQTVLLSLAAERLSGRNPVVAAAIARDAFVAQPDAATRSALVASLRGLHQTDEVGDGRLCGWSADLPGGLLLRMSKGDGAEPRATRSLAGTWTGVVSLDGDEGVVAVDGARFALVAGDKPGPRLFAGATPVPLADLEPPIVVERNEILLPRPVLAFAGDQLVVGDDQGRVTMFGTTGALLASWRPHGGGRIHSLWSVRDRVLTVGVDDGNQFRDVRLSRSDEEQGKILFAESGTRVMRACMSGDTSHLFVALGYGRDQPNRIVCVPTDGAPSCSVLLPAARQAVNTIAADARGERVLVGATSSNVLFLLRRGSAPGAAPDLQAIDTLQSLPMAAVFGPAVPDQPRLLAVGEWAGPIHVYTSEGDEVATLRGHQQAVLHLRFSDDGTEIVSAAVDGTVRRWRLDLPGLAVVRPGRPVQGATWLPDGKQFVAVTLERLALFDRRGRELDAADAGYTGLVSLAVAPSDHPLAGDGTLIACGAEYRALSMWRCRPGTEQPLLQRIPVPEELNSLRSLAVCFVGNDLLLGTKNGRLLLIGPDLIVRWSSEAQAEHPYIGDVAAGARFVVSAGGTTARLWQRGVDAAGAAHISPDSAIAFDVPVTAAVIAPDEQQLLLGLGDGRVVSVELPSARQRVIGYHDGQVRAAAFTRDGKGMLTAGGDGLVKVWTAAGELFVDLPHGGVVHTATFSPDGRHVLTGASDKMARVWPIADDELTQLGRDLLFREPDERERARRLGRR